MSTRMLDYLDAIEHLPEGTTLVIPRASWDEYEHLLGQLEEQGVHARVSYDRGMMRIMTLTREHEEYARFVERLIHVLAELLDLDIQSYGSATWKRQRLARGAEADCCFYVANAYKVIGKRKWDLETDPPPDIVVEIDLTNQSLPKFSIYAALSVPEVWRYDGKKFHFYELAGSKYRGVSRTHSFPSVTPAMLDDALEQCKSDGQTAALRAFRKRWSSKQ
jgi:Uma2 family endonuclease